MQSLRLIASWLVFLLILIAPALTIAQDTGSWLIGTWQGTTPSPAGMGQLDKRELLFKEDGTFKGSVESVRGGLINTSGTWKIVGGEVKLGGTYDTGRNLAGTKFTHSLRRNGEDQLEGTGHSEASGRSFDVSVKRVK